ncbi:recombinase family protein [Streptomyces sp. DT2A-34]|uniref:recombinase family protein n=1 Tax=Streptomyces sp. DT2A-34 TaxID=3051182 RepID=UPI00265C6AEA|nr:recombinase family protein [Streptomyces sp. DT2A-34]MDO0912098.1 recombinase family protein [Streptomyces sp. DT2A-34]
MEVLQHTVSDTCIPLGMYRRVSIDKALKGLESDWREVQEQVKEQEEAIRFLAEHDPELTRRGAVIVRDYCDNDTPASDPFIVRDDFEALLRDLEAGVIRGVLFLHSNRLARLVYDAARVCRIFEMNPDYIGRSVEGSVDLSTVEGRGMFVMQATVGNMEIGNIKRRTKRTNRRVANKGAMHGAPRPFGWGEDRKTLHETEHPFLLAAIRAVPGGLKVGTFRRRLVQFGHVPRKTKRSREGKREIGHAAAEAILTNPRNAGFRMYAPQDERRNAGRLWLPDCIVRDAEGNPVLGDWEPACTPDEYWACVNEIKRRKDNRRDGNKGEPHDTAVKYFLSGIARCGKCLSPMWSNPYEPGTSSYEKWGFRYACLVSQGGCGGVTRCGPPCDDLVESAFLLGTRQGLGDAIEQAAEEIDEKVHDDRLSEIAAEMSDVKRRRSEKRISMGESLDAIEELERERDELLGKRGKLALQKKRKRLLSADALSDWTDLAMEEKRARLTQSIRSVIIHPIGRGKRFDPEFIEIVWHEEPEEEKADA